MTQFFYEVNGETVGSGVLPSFLRNALNNHTATTEMVTSTKPEGVA